MKSRTFAQEVYLMGLQGPDRYVHNMRTTPKKKKQTESGGRQSRAFGMSQPKTVTEKDHGGPRGRVSSCQV